MTDTPRTDNEINRNGELKLGGDPLKYARVESEFARELERELNAANERIKRLENAGDAMFKWSERVGQEFWTAAKEIKP